MDDALKQQLLMSIHASRLVVICGAGLSMGEPSSLPSAESVAVDCWTKYQSEVDPKFPIALKKDLEGIANHFLATDFRYFVSELVPWKKFSRTPNDGHVAIADMLLCKALHSTLTANFDNLIERAAWDLGAEFFACVTAAQANNCHRHGPLLKFHGCPFCVKEGTVWSAQQLSDPSPTPVAKSNHESCVTWMNANLQGKDLLILGFWSDWEYLNDVIAAAFSKLDPNSVTVVDISTTAQLEQKAPVLYKLLSDLKGFRHVPESAASFLRDMRQAFSIAYMRKLFAMGKEAYEQGGGICDPAWIDIPPLEDDAYYHLRRCFEGITNTQLPATQKVPQQSAKRAGLLHVLLSRAGATLSGRYYEFGGKKLQVVNGAGLFVEDLKADYLQPPSLPQPDLVVCAGATTIGTPDNIVRPSSDKTFFRAGSGARWLTDEDARMELAL